ncbi:MAG TPA: glycosyltransferase [Verrucomicrobiae bacterium]|jgi:glycosyltransferase involved in cell wall biosynthesis|nr:glycosyltransferase [Verrucomicrobiae bacterium]
MMGDIVAEMEPVSIIIACYNGEQRLPHLLRSLRSQRYDQTAIDIIVVDDASTDRTIEIARSFGARVFANGHRNIERGKAIGFREARHEYVMFIDDDNRLPHDAWLEHAIEALNENPEAVGVQAAWFSLIGSDPPANRYCSIFGGDPLAVYLRRRDHLARYETRWTLPGEVVAETKRYWKVRFDASNFPTLGSQGFISRRSLIAKTPWDPYLFHIDTNYRLMLDGHDRFIMLRDEIQHDYCLSVRSMLRKKSRDARLFLEQSHMRLFRWQTSPTRFVIALGLMLSVVQPLALSIRAFVRTRDAACFLHPILCVALPLLYFRETIFHVFRRAAKRPRMPN